MNRATFDLAEEMVHQADAAHEEAVRSLATGEPYRPADAITCAVLAIDWRLRALMLSWLEMERPVESPERKPRI